ncbi:hypothetical protein [Spirosoma aerolatum]|uniref:hypothetical protein n=1 Tax=Spirosoma aerolatum TaxID=1211326 RepID=UPI0009AC8EED|nr:hypothetical protein [Spirosoma aerolatum]
MNFIISYGVYPFDLMVSIGEDTETVKKRLSKTNLSRLDIEQTDVYEIVGKGRTVMFSNGATLLRLPHLPETPFEFGVLSHEIFHCVHFLFEKIGIKLSMDSDEAFAYMVGYITSEIFHRAKLTIPCNP